MLGVVQAQHDRMTARSEFRRLLLMGSPQVSSSHCELTTYNFWDKTHRRR